MASTDRERLVDGRRCLEDRLGAMARAGGACTGRCEGVGLIPLPGVSSWVRAVLETGPGRRTPTTRTHKVQHTSLKTVQHTCALPSW